MKLSVTLAPFALSSDGTLLLNAATLDGPLTPAALLKRALRGPGRVFVGIELTRAEAATVVRRTQCVTGEIAAYAAGARQGKQRQPTNTNVRRMPRLAKGRSQR